jgi:AsmA protein
MKTVFKFIGLIIVVLILLFVVSIIVFTKAVNPNDFKNSIDQYVFQKTGRDLVINGNVNWSFFPWLGMDLKQVQLTNPVDFTGPNLANIGEIKVKVRFWPLLKGKVELDKIIVADADINLIKNKNGHTNWEDWRKPSTTSTSPASTTTSITPKIKVKEHWASLNIAGISVTQSTIRLINQKTDETMTLRHFDVSTTPIESGNFFALIMQFTLKPSNSSNVIIPTQLTAKVNFDTTQQTYQLNNIVLNSTIERPKLPSLRFLLQGNINGNLNQQTLTFDPLTAQLVNLSFSGKMQITQILQTPVINATFTSENTGLEPLVTTLLGKNFLRGNLSFNTTLNTTGDTQQELTKNLNGSGKLTITDGAIIGFNLKDSLAKGEAAINKQPLPQTSGTPETSFSHLTASYVMQQGIVRNDDLSLLGGEISATGHGSIDLNYKTMHYIFTAQYSPANKSGQPPLIIPVIVSGSLSSPAIKPDFSGVIKSLVTQAVEKKIEKLTGQKLNLQKLLH